VITHLPAPHGVLLRITDYKVREEIDFDTLPLAKATSLVADPQTGIWLALVNGDIAHWHDGKADKFAMHREPNSGFISSMLGLPDGSVLASSMFGVIGIRNGISQALTGENGMPCLRVWTMAAAPSGLWLYFRVRLGVDIQRGA
jgi:hypothetical protein